MLLEWMTKYEPIWLALAFLVSILFEAFTAYWVLKEYQYDEKKDIEKKYRRTRTSKKTTTQPGGGSITEESTEITDPISELPK